MFNDDINLDQLALSVFDSNLLVTFNTTLDLDTISIYDIYNERWFNLDLQLFTIESIDYTNVYRVCRSKSREGSATKKQGAPLLISAGNRIDPGRIDYSIEDPTIVKEMLIARVYI